MAEGPQRLVEPPAAGAAEGADVLARFIENVDEHDRPAGRVSGGEGGVVREAQIVAKPEEDGFVGQFCSRAAGLERVRAGGRDGSVHPLRGRRVPRRVGDI
jgi:hypothetical protein